MTQPIDMVLHCPKCGLQHIDAADDHPELRDLRVKPWTNPPHRSHLCHGCGHIWRPADVPTNGVRAVLTKGKDDSPIRDCRVGHTHKYSDYYVSGVWQGSKCRHCGDVLPF
jgi:hypothetical protein